MRRIEIAKLREYAEFGCGWFGVLFYHLCRVAELKSHANHFFLCFSQKSYGMAVQSFCLFEKTRSDKKGSRSRRRNARGGHSQEDNRFIVQREA